MTRRKWNWKLKDVTLKHALLTGFAVLLLEVTLSMFPMPTTVHSSASNAIEKPVDALGFSNVQHSERTAMVEGDHAIATMATWPGNQATVARTIESLLDQTVPLTRILIYMNQYLSIPADWPKPSKVLIYVIGDQHLGNMGDTGKFAFVKGAPLSHLVGLPNEDYFHFTVDDDIIYPRDYVYEMIKHLEDHHRKPIAGIHCRILPPQGFLNMLNQIPQTLRTDPHQNAPILNAFFCQYTKTGKTRGFKFRHNQGSFCHVVGTGTTAYHTSHVQIELSDFPHYGRMADFVVARLAQERKYKLLCVPRRAGWLTQSVTPVDSSLWEKAQSDQIYRLALMEAVLANPWELHVKNSAHALAHTTQRFLVSTYKTTDPAWPHLLPTELANYDPMSDCRSFDSTLAQCSGDLLDEFRDLLIRFAIDSSDAYPAIFSYWGCSGWINKTDNTARLTPEFIINNERGQQFGRWQVLLDTHSHQHLPSSFYQQLTKSEFESELATMQSAMKANGKPVYHVVMPFGDNVLESEHMLQNAIHSTLHQVSEAKILYLVHDGSPNMADNNPKLAEILGVLCHQGSRARHEGEPSYGFTKYNAPGLGATFVVCLSTSDVGSNPSMGSAYSKYIGFETARQFSQSSDIMVVVDGDDELVRPDALSLIGHTYETRGCLFSYGSMDGLYSDQQAALPLLEDGSFVPRHSRWVYSHPRTFRAFLVDHVPIEDFQDDEGEWLLKVTDRGFVFRMLELSGAKRTCFIPTKIYGYLTSAGGPASNQAVTLEKKNLIINRFANMKPSMPLPDKFISIPIPVDHAVDHVDN